MVDEILKNEANIGKTIYTRDDWYDHYKSNSQIKFLPTLPFTGVNKVDQAFHWNSGPYSVLVAALKKPKEIYLLGFDLWSKTSFINNVYKGTANYAGPHDRKVNPDFWIHQLNKLFNHFSEIEFIQLQPENWRIPEQWKTIKNLTIQKL